MATFGGVTFKFVIAGHQYGAQSVYNVESIPEGSTIVIDIGGAGEERISGTCVFTSFTNLLTMIGYAANATAGTLNYTEQSRPAILVSCQRNNVVPGAGGQKNHLARCEWILTG